MVNNNTYLVIERNGDAKAEIFEAKDGLFYILDVCDERPVMGPYPTLDRAAAVAENLDIEQWLDGIDGLERGEAETVYAQRKGWA
jgi:hypothetical protein